MTTLATAAALMSAFAVAVSPRLSAQQAPGAAAQQPATPQAASPIDLTGNWVAQVTEEWRWRMVTPPRGDFVTLPLTPAARKVGEAWDPAKDAAEGNACRAYGAIGIMRLPVRLRVSWQDERTLKMEIDAGEQTRLFRFGDDIARPSGDAGWQGFSSARWQAPGGGDLPRPGPGAAAGGAAAPAAPAPRGRGGSLKVLTTNMRPGYLRRNGAPYTQNASMTEHFYTHRAPNGDQWLTVTQIVHDPEYLNTDYVSSWQFKKEPDGSKWRPTPCVAS